MGFISKTSMSMTSKRHPIWGCLKRRHVYEATRLRSRSAEIIEHAYNKNIIIIILLLVAKFQGNIVAIMNFPEKLKPKYILNKFELQHILLLMEVIRGGLLWGSIRGVK